MRRTTFAFAGAALLLTSAAAPAAIISVNFAEESSGDIAASVTAGVLPVNNWNNLRDNDSTSVTVSNLKDNLGPIPERR